MQLNPVYLYSNKVDVFTTVLDPWTTERYRKVYQRNFKAYRGVDNRIDLQVRNSDQKTMNVSEYTLVFNLIERETQKLIISRNCTASSLINGKAYVVLTETDLNNIQDGFYNYTVHTVKDGVKAPLYIDSQYGAFATIEVSGDMFGTTQPSQVIDTFSIIPTTRPGEIYSTSEIQYASPEVDSTATVHTFAIYQTDYLGTVEVEASMELGATPNVWTTVATIDYTTKNNNTRYQNVEGVWNYFRIKYVPSVGRFTISYSRENEYRVKLDNAGKGYSINDQFTIKGSKLDGIDSVHDLIITVTSVNNIGAIVSFTFTGVSNYQSSAQTKIISLGSIDKVLYR